MRDDLQELVDEVSRLLGRPGHAGGRRVHPARLLRARRQPRRGDGRRPHPLDPDPRLTGGHPRLVRGVRHRRRRGAAAHARPTRPPASSPGWSSRCGTPGAPAATCGCSTAAASTRPTTATRRSPPPSTSPPRPAGCSPSAPPPTRTSAGPLAAALTGSARGRAPAVRALAAVPRRAAPRRCWWRCCPGRPGCRPAGGSRAPARSPRRWRTAGAWVAVLRAAGRARRPAPGRRPGRGLARRPAAGQRGRGVRRPAGRRRPARRSGRRRGPRPGWRPPCPRLVPGRRTGPSSAPGGRSASCAGPDPVVVPLLADPVLSRDRRGLPRLRRQRVPGAPRRCRSTGRRCTTGWPGSSELTGLDLADGEARLLLHLAQAPAPPEA